MSIRSMYLRSSQVQSLAPIAAVAASSNLSPEQAAMEAAGWISFLATMLRQGAQDGINLAQQKLNELLANPNLDKSYADLIQQALSITTSSDFASWWVLKDAEGKDGPMQAFLSALKEGDSTPSSIHTPTGDDGAYNFCISMFVIDLSKSAAGELTDFSEKFFGYYDIEGTGLDQCATAAREIAYYLQQNNINEDQIVNAIADIPSPGTWTQKFIDKLKADVLVQQTSASINDAATAWDDYADNKHIFG